METVPVSRVMLVPDTATLAMQELLTQVGAGGGRQPVGSSERFTGRVFRRSRKMRTSGGCGGWQGTTMWLGVVGQLDDHLRRVGSRARCPSPFRYSLRVVSVWPWT